MNIRTAQKNDTQEISHLLKNIGMWHEWDEGEGLLSLIDNERVVVVRSEDRIIAVVYTIWFSKTVLHVYRLAVAPEYQGKGVGSDLLTYVEQMAKNKGAVEVGFYVNSSEAELQEFYKKRGFQTSGNTFSYYCKELGDS